MLNEFYKYIANNTISFFQRQANMIRPGERYCLRLDTEEMVSGVNLALENKTMADGIQGTYLYGSVYKTFTIKLSSSTEVVVASKTAGMTDDFLATLRNAELTEKRFPILMITHSPIDTITSGTGDLSANGMPFHASSIIAKIKEDIAAAQLSDADQVMLELELERKQGDRFSDKSSLYEYSNLLTVLGRGYVERSDFETFGLLYDDHLSAIPKDHLRARLQENQKIFEFIDRTVRHGNIEDDLDREYDRPFIEHLITAKKKGNPWHDGYTFDLIKASHDRLVTKKNNPLHIENEWIEFYSGSAMEYPFPVDTLAFIRDDGETKAKQRRKNILIYNPDQRPLVTIHIRNINAAIKSSWIDCAGATYQIHAKELQIQVDATGCAFARITIKDPNNNITYLFKICVLNISPKYFEEVQTNYLLDVPRNIKKSAIQAVGLCKQLLINPGANPPSTFTLQNDAEYICNYNQTLCLSLGDDDLDVDSGIISFRLKCGAVEIPFQIKDEAKKPVELTGINAFKVKYEKKRGFEYRNGRIVHGTTEYYAKSPFKDHLEYENTLIQNRWLAAYNTINGLTECDLNVSDAVRSSYLALVDAYKKCRQLPSLAYLSGELLDSARRYVAVIQDELEQIPSGQTLSSTQNALLMLGCIQSKHDERTIFMSPLHPINVMYQLTLLEEKHVGDVREQLVEKLTPLYLLPYIRNLDKELYHAIEQRHSPEWRTYVPLSNKRYQGARNFVQKLVSDKITQYISHFNFLFDDLRNDTFCINLVSMGDCREVLQGLIRFYAKELNSGIELDHLKRFVVNIYNHPGEYNDFSILSNQNKLKEYISAYSRDVKGEDVSEMALILSKNIRCYYRNANDETYQYAHLTFYEMMSAEDSGASRMDLISTGMALGGIISGTPSVLNYNWYKTGFGTKYAPNTPLVQMAKHYNAMFRVAFSGSSYDPDSSIFTEISQDGDEQLKKIYASSNWVVFVDPKVDLSFFTEDKNHQDLMIIHYSDQYTSSSGYDDITVTQKSEQYAEIILEQLKLKGVSANQEDIHNIINLFNAINGGWLLRLISAKKLFGAVDSNFSREKMSILSAVKFCMAYFAHEHIVWVPISLEEMLRVSGGAGYSQKDGLLSAKNLGFEKGVTSDDLLMVGIEGPVEHLKLHLHPVEVKIGENASSTISKAIEQVRATKRGLQNALWPNEHADHLECKLSRNFLMQLVITCCEKMKLYQVYPHEQWDLVLDTYREALLNEHYEFSSALDEILGEGTVISFKSDVLNKKGSINDRLCLLEFPEKMGSQYMVKSAAELSEDLDRDPGALPKRLADRYTHPISGEDPNPAETLSPLQEEAPSTPENDVSDESIAIAPSTPMESINSSIVPTISEEPTIPAPDSQDSEEKISVDISPIPQKPIAPDTVKADPSSTSDQRKCMEVLFGQNLSNGQKLIWYPNDTNQIFHTNTGIIGTMGTGKTQFTKSLITQLYRDQMHNFDGSPLGILIFDYKGDYNESKEDFIQATHAKVLKPYHLPYNPLALTKSRVFKPLLPIHTANAFKDTLSKVYSLGPKQQNALFSCITQSYKSRGIDENDPKTWENIAPTFDSVYSIYVNDEDIKKTDSLAAAMDKLHQFQVFEGDPNNTKSLFDILEGVVVIDLSGYDSDIQSLIVAITLDLFYSQMQAAGSSKMDQQYRQLTKLILVDEADNFMSEGFTSLKKILKEGREFGVGTILSTQFLKHFGTTDDDYAKYILTWVVHNVADLKPSDVEFVFKIEAKSAESQTLFNDIKGLKKHHSIVKIGTSQPCYIEDKAFWELYRDMTAD